MTPMTPMMPTIPGYHITEELHRGAKTIVYSGFREHDACPVIFKMPNTEYPTLKDQARLQHEFSLTKDWHEPGLIRAYALLPYQNTQVLVLQNIGGITIKKLLTQKTFTVDEFLRLALGFAKSLSQIHEHQIIHKDINPANLIVNPATGETQIIDFGISSQLSRERPELQNPGHLEGTLAYLSPEQTGRMNRTIDYRADFYSLGASFYEMLTGEPPFAATDPMELVHCHLAKMPRSPHELRPELPPLIAELVLKLMAKTAEARYQSGYGLCADLEICLQQFSALQTIAPFPLGQHDVSTRFQIPQTLYGREKEVQQVLDAFGRVSLGQTEMLLVAGYSGIGKTALVHEVYKPITKKNGYFIHGKFDQFQRDIPHACLIEAFRELVRQLLTESPPRIARWQTLLTKALGANAQVIIDVIPDVALILGPQAALSSLPPQEAHNRFQSSFRQFIEVFAKAAHPLVLFLDDLQWADFASLRFLEDLLLLSQDQCLLILGSYRDNEVDATHPFMLSLDTLRKAGASFNTLKLAPLGFADLEHLVQDTLTPSKENYGPLAELVLQKTGGNPFFINAFLTRLYEAALLSFSAAQGGWQWDMERIGAQQITANVVELMSQKLRTLAIETQQLLVQAACIGHQFDLATLCKIGEHSTQNAIQNLWQAIKAGLLQQQGNCQIEEMMLDAAKARAEMTAYRFRFVHDQVQQAAYELWSADETAALHLKIGRLWLQQLNLAETDEALFATTKQFQGAISLIHDKTERETLAWLNLQAGRKAIASTAFSSALRYLDSGLSLLDGGDWKNHYELTLALSLEQAVCEYVNHQHDLAAQHFKICLEQTKTDLEKANIHLQYMELYGSQGEYQRALNEGLAGLRLLRIRLPMHPRKHHMLAEILKEKWYRRGKKVNFALHHLPIATSLGHRPEHRAEHRPEHRPEHQLAVKILSSIAPFASFVNLPLTGLIIIKGVNLLHRRGISPDAAYILMTFSALLIVARRYPLAWDYAEKATALCQSQTHAKQLMPLHMFANAINHWYHPLHTSVTRLEHCLNLALESGNWVYASFCMANLLLAMFGASHELHDFTTQGRRFSQLFEQMHDPNRIGSFTTFCIAWSQGLMGYDAEGHPYNNLAAVAEASLKNTPNSAARCFIHILCAFYELVFENGYQAAIYLEKARPLLIDVVGMQISTDFFFLEILITARDKNGPNNKKKSLKLQAGLQKLREWATQCPANFTHKYLLCAAEIAFLEGRNDQAQSLYDQAVETAQKNGFIHHQALACEYAADFYLAQGKAKFADIYLETAHYLYTKWGAQAKVKRLEKKYPHLLNKYNKTDNSKYGSTTVGSITHTISGKAGAKKLDSESLDLGTVMKATQALSGEIVLEQLLKKLMRIVIENAGAQHGALLLETDGEWRIEAEGNINETAIRVLHAQALIPALADTANQLSPVSLVHYVALTKEALVLDNACTEGRFMNDPYIQKNQVKAVLCIPILHQAKVVGILYLENNLAQGAFTADRLEMLKILSSQAAISIENARAYEKLESTVAQRTAALSESNSALSLACTAAENSRQQAESAEQKATRALDDLRTTQTQLVQSEKMASLGQLVASVAHEINTPIGVVKSSGNLITQSLGHALTEIPRLFEKLDADHLGLFLQLIANTNETQALQSSREQRAITREITLALEAAGIQETRRKADILMQLRMQSKITDFLPLLRHPECEFILNTAHSIGIMGKSARNINTAADQVAKIVFALKSFSHSDGTGKMVEARLQDGLETVLTIYQSQIRQGTELVREFEDIAPLYCLPDELNQVWTNLIHNALQAMNYQGTLSLTLRRCSNEAVVSVGDTGCGIPENIRERIFDAFFTTKPAGEGSGLGLNIAKKIIEKHQGRMEVRSETGVGTTIFVYLPYTK